MRALLAALAALCAFAQPGLNRPLLGQMLDAQGDLWPLFGVPGSFLLGVAQAGGVFSVACSAQLCLAKTESGILVNGVYSAAPRGPALMALDGSAAWLYFPLSRRFARWQAGVLTPVDQIVDGQVLSLQPGLTLAVRRSNGIWIVSSDGSILDALPPDAGAVLLIPGGVIYATADSLALRRPSGSEVRFPAPGVTALFQIGEGLVEARAGSIAYALRTTAGNEGLFRLPQPHAILRR